MLDLHASAEYDAVDHLGSQHDCRRLVRYRRGHTDRPRFDKLFCRSARRDFSGLARPSPVCARDFAHLRALSRWQRPPVSGSKIPFPKPADAGDDWGEGLSAQHSTADLRIHARFRTKRQPFLRSRAASVDAYLGVTPARSASEGGGQESIRQCHAASCLRSVGRTGSQGNEENQLQWVPFPSGDH